MPVALSDAERGRQLFVAKGCSTCHAKLQDDQNVELRVADFGPSLVGRTLSMDYLTTKIKNPAEGRSTVAGSLDGREVEALVRYVNGSWTAEQGG